MIVLQVIPKFQTGNDIASDNDMIHIQIFVILYSFLKLYSALALSNIMFYNSNTTSDMKPFVYIPFITLLDDRSIHLYQDYYTGHANVPCGLNAMTLAI